MRRRDIENFALTGMIKQRRGKPREKILRLSSYITRIMQQRGTCIHPPFFIRLSRGARGTTLLGRTWGRRSRIRGRDCDVIIVLERTDDVVGWVCSSDVKGRRGSPWGREEERHEGSWRRRFWGRGVTRRVDQAVNCRDMPL